MVTKEQIKQKVMTDRLWTEKAVLAIYKLQTSDEQRGKFTNHENKVGFNKIDAEILTSFAQWLLTGRHLSQKQLSIAQKRIGKYSGQLYAIASQKEGNESPKENVTKKTVTKEPKEQPFSFDKYAKFTKANVKFSLEKIGDSEVLLSTGFKEFMKDFGDLAKQLVTTDVYSTGVRTCMKILLDCKPPSVTFLYLGSNDEKDKRFGNPDLFQVFWRPLPGYIPENRKHAFTKEFSFPLFSASTSCLNSNGELISTALYMLESER